MIDRSLLNHGFPGSTWANLGLWIDARHYPAACEALAERLAQHAQLQANQSVLDVGFGYGDQLLVWKQGFGVGRIRGVEIDPAAIAHARCKVADYSDVTLRLGDGHFDAFSEHYDRVLALDCAYHFSQRSAFFATAYQTLVPGGRLGITDIVLAEGENSETYRWLASACGIPPENLITQDAYAQALTDQGFIHVRIVQLDEDVFRGFSRFAFRHLRSRGLRAFSKGGLQVLITAIAAAWLCRTQHIHYVLISAERP
ncbi:MAG: methyltransferase domain-containing protein [Candidatus Saccharibacteria bacterium]|nr:methyltransferase domain-containing protein [Rhodoferax sp.]